VNEELLLVRKICTGIMTKCEGGGKFKTILARVKKSFAVLDLKIRTKRMKDLEENEFYVNAYYDTVDDADGLCPIEVVILHNIDEDTDFAHAQAGQLIVQIYDAVVHELRHQYQGRRRNYLSLTAPDDEAVYYLSDPDEIDAYALSIALELIRNLGRTRSIQYLHRASQLAKIRPKGLYASPNLFAYFDTFGDVGHPVIKKLIKKVFLNLETVDKSAVFY
jgi:hypothetical protein